MEEHDRRHPHKNGVSAESNKASFSSSTTATTPHAHEQATTPPPPGFPQGLSPSSSSTGVAAIYEGESLRAGSGALSAPPPPGFMDGVEERARRANQIRLGERQEASNQGIGPVASLSQFDKRTTSFSNLAAMVGTGLAESMDDSTRDQIRAEANPLVFDPSQDLSYARQSRHAASRLIGSSSNSGLGPGSSSSHYSSLLAPVPPSKKKLDSNDHLSHSTFSHRKSQLTDARTSESPYRVEHDMLADFKPSPSKQRQWQALGAHDASGAVAYHERSGPPTHSDVGLTVVEPLDMGQIHHASGRSHQPTPEIPRHGTPDLVDLQRNMQKMTVDRDSNRSSSNASAMEFSAGSPEDELEQFMWDAHRTEPSRGLVILGTQALNLSDIRSTCEAFGILEIFRSDFADRGIVFIGYYDVRSAQYAALELKSCLLRLLPRDRVDTHIDVKYCVPLNTSSTQDESVIVLSDLPRTADEGRLSQILASFGDVRSLSRQMGSRYSGSGTYVVEYFNVQDAKQALLELESIQPWGRDVLVEMGTRTAADRKLGRDLLSMIARWRHTISQTANSASFNGAKPGHSTTVTESRIQSHARAGAPSNRHVVPQGPIESALSSYALGRNDSSETTSLSSPSQSTQLVLGPDGRYSYVVVNQSAYPPGHIPPQHIDMQHGALRATHLQQQQQQQIVSGPHGSYISQGATHLSQQSTQGSQPGGQYWPSQAPPPPAHAQPSYSHAGLAPGATVYLEGHGYATVSATTTTATSVPYYAHVVTSQTDSSVSSESAGQQQVVKRPVVSTSGQEEKETGHLVLSIDTVECGRDTRTSLMVRNIPNKYTQQMLLAEFAESGHGPGIIDFFYLPIDFKNKCNRGYAFVNFVDFRDIVSFHRQYFGQHWKVFNSDKICDITYARIQGKQGMLKRFENSALMEKDESYKPLVFVSHGPDKGKRVAFPSNGSERGG